MLKLAPEQEQVFNRVAAKAKSIGLIRAGEPTWYWSHSYQVPDAEKLIIGCSCDPNVANSPVSIMVMVPLPNTGKYAKYESRSYSIEQFENLNGPDLVALAMHVQAQTTEIEELEAKLKGLRKDLEKHAKKALR